MKVTYLLFLGLLCLAPSTRAFAISLRFDAFAGGGYGLYQAEDSYHTMPLHYGLNTQVKLWDHLLVGISALENQHYYNVAGVNKIASERLIGPIIGVSIGSVHEFALNLSYYTHRSLLVHSDNSLTINDERYRHVSRSTQVGPLGAGLSISYLKTGDQKPIGFHLKTHYGIAINAQMQTIQSRSDRVLIFRSSAEPVHDLNDLDVSYSLTTISAALVFGIELFP